jgi:hypothetical protein
VSLKALGHLAHGVGAVVEPAQPRCQPAAERAQPHHRPPPRHLPRPTPTPASLSALRERPVQEDGARAFALA